MSNIYKEMVYTFKDYEGGREVLSSMLALKKMHLQDVKREIRATLRTGDAFYADHLKQCKEWAAEDEAIIAEIKKLLAIARG